MSPDEARALLVSVGAPERLVRHGELVLEAAEALLAEVAPRVSVDADRVRAGALLHDIGKTKFSSELSAPGSEHEEAGESLLLDRGVDASIARICITHAQWSTMPCDLEELLVALADKLWKGVRVEQLEQRVVAELASRLGVDAWSVFVDLDACFEAIAEGGETRLRRSRP